MRRYLTSSERCQAGFRRSSLLDLSLQTSVSTSAAKPQVGLRGRHQQVARIRFVTQPARELIVRQPERPHSDNSAQWTITQTGRRRHL
jgi:hypothetical protein